MSGPAVVSSQLRLQPPTPVTVFTGFLGAGKTTIILSLIARLPSTYRVVLDSALAAQQNIAGVREMLNGCLCCTLVGQLSGAVEEINAQYSPDRIGFSRAYCMANSRIREEWASTRPLGFHTVVDCEHFRGYEDTSYTARMQAQYTDIILLNKWEEVGERELDLVLDHVYELNPDTPKIKCDGKRGVDPSLLFGLDTQLFQLGAVPLYDAHQPADHMDNEVDVFTLRRPFSAAQGLLQSRRGLKLETVERFFARKEFASAEHFYRIKGFIWLDKHEDELTRDANELGMHAHATDKSRAEKGTVDLKDTGSNDTCHLVIFNLAFGRSEWSAPITDASLVEQHNSCSLLLSVMGTGLLSHGEDGSHHTQNGETCGLSPSDERMRYDEWRERVKPWVRTLFEELIEIGK